MIWKAELLSTFETAVCECWNLSDKYSCDNDIKQLWTRRAVRII